MARSPDPRALLADLVERPAQALERHGAGIPELASLRGCPQPPNHHAEGDVWTHTTLALRTLQELPQAVERHAGAALAGAGVRPRWPARSATQALAVLLHDVGKPLTIAGPEGRWTYYHHDRVGADLAAHLIDRLGLVAVAGALGVELDAEAVSWLVAEHLFWLNTDPALVTDRAVRRRFVRDDGRGEDLRVLSWCDTLGSYGPDGRPHVDLMVSAERRIAQVRTRAAAEAARPAPLLDGHEVMATLGVDQGPRVGAVLAWLRARSDTEAQARRLLRSQAPRLASAPLETLRDER